MPLIAVGGCAVNYPDLYTAPVPVAASEADQDLAGILTKAVELQGKYASGYKESAQNADVSQLPIIGAAGLAALVLLNDKANAATDAAKIGIGTGVYSAGRSALTATGLPEIYIAGHGALTCVISEGPRFVGAQGLRAFADFEGQIGTHADVMRAIEILSQRSPSGTPTAAQTATLEAARNLAKESLAQARTIEASALTQKGAFRTASPVFGNSVASISARVASKGRVRPAVEFAALRDSFKASPPATSDARAQGLIDGGQAGVVATNPSAEELTGLTIALTQYLITEGSRLRASTPDYVDALTRVSKCPESIN
jgi:hypothetical protein